MITRATAIAAAPYLHIVWHGIPFSQYDCELVCALTIYVTFEDKTPLDHITIGKMVGAASGLESMNCEGLVDHLSRTNDIYPKVLQGGDQWHVWAKNIWNLWLDPEAAPIGSWP